MPTAPVATEPTEPDALTLSSRRVLQSWSAPDGAQERLRLRYLDAIDAGLRTGQQPWARACPVAHLTASAIVLSPAGDQALLIRHALVGRWLQVGGHLEAGDADLAAAALREAEEETGLPGHLDPVPVQLSAHPAPCRTAETHLDVQFLVCADPDRTLRPERDPVRWFARAGLPADLEPAILDLIQRAASRLGG